MYVYVKDGKIWLKSETRIRVPGATEYKTEHKITDRLIYEGGQIKVYEDSKQYGEDINRYHLQKELKNTKKKNEDLLRIANNKIRKEMELEVKGKEPDEYHRKIYLLKKLKGSQHLGGQESG